jgi:hypothetical protein
MSEDDKEMLKDDLRLNRVRDNAFDGVKETEDEVKKETNTYPSYSNTYESGSNLRSDAAAGASSANSIDDNCIRDEEKYSANASQSQESDVKFPGGEKSWKEVRTQSECKNMVPIRALLAASAAKFNISTGRWQHFWPVAIVLTKR